MLQNLLKCLYCNMLVPTLNCCSTQSLCKFRHLSCDGTNFYMPLYAFHTAVMHVFFLLVTPQTMTGKKFVEVEKDMIITLEQGRDYMEDARKFPTSIICMPTSFITSTLVLPSLIINVPHIPLVYCTFTMHFNILPVNFCQTFLAFKIVSPTVLHR
jgi:hypothetical protein